VTFQNQKVISIIKPYSLHKYIKVKAMYLPLPKEILFN